MINYYDTLNIKPDATEDEIKKGFRLFAVKYHPDKSFGGIDFAQRFNMIKEAYDTLINPHKRKNYDHKLNDYFKKQTSYSQVKDLNENYLDSTQPEEKLPHQLSKILHYSQNERDQRETPQCKPVFDLFGEKLHDEIDFFKMPRIIGRIIAGFSDLTSDTQPLTYGQKAKNNLIGVIIGLVIGALIYFLGNPGPVWAVIWLLTPTLVILWFVSLSNKFKHKNLFIGVNGFAEYECENNRNNLTCDIELNFNDITDLYLYQVEKKMNFEYQFTDYVYIFLNTKNNTVLYLKEGRFDKKDKPEEQSIDIVFYRKVEQFWTIFLLDKMEKKLEESGYILFNLYDPQKNLYLPYIKLSVGQITFIKGEREEFTYNFNDIKRIYSKNSELFIEHKNFQKSFFFSDKGNLEKIPMHNLCNRLFFFRAMELLLGYTI